jgi:hypothetical protein
MGKEPAGRASETLSSPAHSAIESLQTAAVTVTGHVLGQAPDQRREFVLGERLRSRSRLVRRGQCVVCCLYCRRFCRRRLAIDHLDLGSGYRRSLLFSSAASRQRAWARYQQGYPQRGWPILAPYELTKRFGAELSKRPEFARGPEPSGSRSCNGRATRCARSPSGSGVYAVAESSVSRWKRTRAGPPLVPRC